jgi:hypothetical protein
MEHPGQIALRKLRMGTICTSWNKTHGLRMARMPCRYEARTSVACPGVLSKTFLLCGSWEGTTAQARLH